MNKLIRIFIASFFITSFSYSQEYADNPAKITELSNIELNWMPTYKKALKKAKKEKKPILIYFTGSDWCGPCKILDAQLFHTEKFKSLSDKNFILLEVDIPRRRDLIAPNKMKENLKLQKKYKVKAFPTLLFVNHRGKKVDEKNGVIMTEYYYPFFNKTIKKYSK